MTDTAPCPWCAAPVERRKVGKHLKVYCNQTCKNHFNNAMSRLASLITRSAQEAGYLKELSNKLSDPAGTG